MATTTKKPTKRRRNSTASEAAAAALSARFHGRPAHSMKEITEATRTRTTLTELGRLIEITAVLPDGKTQITIPFNKEKTSLASSPDGGQLYIVGGDQGLDLAALGLSKLLPKDYLDLGDVAGIVYETRKGFDNFERLEYEHAMGERGGQAPRLGYDTRNKRLYIQGGTYQVKPEGIVH